MSETYMYKISVLMSVYKIKEEHLRISIESILNQTFKNFEFIIIIDGIDKNIKSVIESYQDNRIIIHQNLQNIGLTKSLNIGLNLAKGKYIARMDADDISYSSRLQIQYDYMEKNINVVAVGSYAKNIGKKGFTGQTFSNNREILRIRLMFYNAGLIHPTAFIRKDFLEKYNIRYDETIKKYSEDYALWVEILKFGKIEVINRPLLAYRRHDGQISNLNIGKYDRIIRDKQWNDLGVVFSESEKKLINSFNKSNISENSKKYAQFFNKLMTLNNKNNYFNKKLFDNEVDRIWFYLTIKKIFYSHKLDMLFNLRSLRILNPSLAFYCFYYYVLCNFKPYLYDLKTANEIDFSNFADKKV